MSEPLAGNREGPEPALSRLDPDRAAGGEPEPDPRAPAAIPPPAPGAVDTRRYRWMIGIFGLVVVIVVSIYQFATNGVSGAGVPSGARMRYFAAPLAGTSLVGDPNLQPPCTLSRHDRRALNVCLILARRPLVLAFFVIGSADCEHQVDVLQRLSTRFAASAVQFAAVAINASRADTTALVRSHHWTIPVAYDRDGAVGSLYGVEVCPMVQLAYRGGIVKDRLIGGQWETSAALAPRVAALLRGPAPG